MAREPDSRDEEIADQRAIASWLESLITLTPWILAAFVFVLGVPWAEAVFAEYGVALPWSTIKLIEIRRLLPALPELPLDALNHKVVRKLLLFGFVLMVSGFGVALTRLGIRRHRSVKRVLFWTGAIMLVVQLQAIVRPMASLIEALSTRP